MEQTKLQKIVEQKAEQMRGAIEQAIDEGAESQKEYNNLCKIDGVMVWKNEEGTNSVILRFKSPKIAKVFDYIT